MSGYHKVEIVVNGRLKIPVGSLSRAAFGSDTRRKKNQSKSPKKLKE
jgi:hypothetical protein